MSAFLSDKVFVFRGFFGGPSETRTPDPLIKSKLPAQKMSDDPEKNSTKSRKNGG
jgi:hypothetical protein